MNVHAIRSIYLFEMARFFRNTDPELYLAGDFDGSLLCCVRSRDRQSN